MNMMDDGNIVNGDYYRDPSADIAKHGGVPVYRKVKDKSDPPEFDEDEPVYLFYCDPKLSGAKPNYRGWWVSDDPNSNDY